MTIYSGGPGYYAVYRGPNMWLRLEAQPNGGGSGTPVSIQSGYDDATELYIYIDGRPAFKAGSYRSEPQFYQSFSALTSVLVTTQPTASIYNIQPTTGSTITTAPAAPTPATPGTTTRPMNFILPLAALAGIAALLGLTRKKRR